MHVSAKKIATAGVLAAVSVLLNVLGSVIETNSLFLIAAAAFCVGIAVREWGERFGAGFLTACVFLNILLIPNKIYCLTFTAMGLYILLSEFLWGKIANAHNLKKRTLLLWCGKYMIFNAMYVPVLVCIPSLIFTKRIEGNMIWILWAAGQAALFVFDKAYLYFQGTVWGNLRKKLMK